MDLTLETFEHLVGETFAVDGGDLTLTLTGTTALAQFPGAPRPPFALEFRSNSGENLGQGMVALRHPRHGTIALFVVASGIADGAVTYHASVN